MINWYLVDHINPEPWTASEGSVGRKNGKNFVMFHKPTQLRNYQEALKKEFPEQNPDTPMYDGFLYVVFFFWRRQELVETSERNTRANTADVTNLQKATEDALQGILYKNDRHNRSVCGNIVEQSPQTEPSILIGIGPYDPTIMVSAVVQRAEMLGKRDAARAMGISSVNQRPDIPDIF